MRKLLGRLKALNWRQVLLYGGLFSVLFVFFLYLTFPFEIVRDLIVEKFESQGKFEVAIQDISPFRLSGVEIKGLKVSDPEKAGKVYFNLDEVRLRVRPTQLLLGRLWLDFDLYAYGGGMAGSFCSHSGTVDLAANFVNLTLNKYNLRDLVSQYGQFDIDGILNGDFNIHFNRTARQGNSGAVNLSYDKLRLVNVTLIGKTIPNMTFEPGKISLELKHRNFKINDFNLKGNNLELSAGGQIFINDTNPTKSSLSLNMKMKPSAEVEDAMGLLAYGLGEPDDSGYYQIRLNGPLDKLRTGH